MTSDREYYWVAVASVDPNDYTRPHIAILTEPAINYPVIGDTLKECAKAIEEWMTEQEHDVDQTTVAYTQVWFDADDPQIWIRESLLEAALDEMEVKLDASNVQKPFTAALREAGVKGDCLYWYGKIDVLPYTKFVMIAHGSTFRRVA